MACYDKKGREIPDQEPIEVPLEFKRPPTLQEEIKRYIRVEMSRAAEEEGLETFEEADDFSDDDDDFPLSQHELTEMQEEMPRGMLRARSSEGAQREGADSGNNQSRIDGAGTAGSGGSTGRDVVVSQAASGKVADSGGAKSGGADAGGSAVGAR